MSKKQPSAMGVALGLLLWGLCFLGLPKFVEMDTIAAIPCFALGFVLLLLGIMGTCIEASKRYQEGRNDD